MQTNVEKINTILVTFNFEKVHAYMVLTDWKWSMRDGDKEVFRIPTLEEIKEHAQRFLVSVSLAAEPSSCHGSGGFNAYKFPWGFKLTFEPFSKSSY